MAKLKGPLFGLQAHGTLANSLTYQSTNKLAVAKTIPTHPDVATLAQRDHRFLYSLGIALWHGMAAAERAVYVARAVGHNFTPMNAWLSEWLTTLPNLTLALPIQEESGSVLHNVSPTDASATLYGPTWARSQARPYISADGIDDYAVLTPPTALALQTTTWTLAFRLRIDQHRVQDRLFDKGSPIGYEWMIWEQATLALAFWETTFPTPYTTKTLSNQVINGQWATWALTCTIPTVTWFKNGQNVTLLSGAHRIPTYVANSLHLFRVWNIPANPSDAALAWLIAFNRALTPAEILAVSTYKALTLPT